VDRATAASVVGSLVVHGFSYPVYEFGFWCDTQHYKFKLSQPHDNAIEFFLALLSTKSIVREPKFEFFENESH
jgi:hypothetical protein